MVTYTTKVLIPLKPVMKRVLAFYRLPVLVRVKKYGKKSVLISRLSGYGENND